MLYRTISIAATPLYADKNSKPYVYVKIRMASLVNKINFT